MLPSEKEEAARWLSRPKVIATQDQNVPNRAGATHNPVPEPQLVTMPSHTLVPMYLSPNLSWY